MKTDTPLVTHGKVAGRFRFISFGDVHLVHPRTPTSLVLKNLTTYAVNDTVFRHLDMCFITGDLFDSLVSNNDPRLYEVHRWLTYLLRMCAKHDVLLRIVEGTPSHDRGQSIFLPEQAKNAEIDVDLHYAETLSIEYIPRFDLHVLYVPDKWRNDTSETLQEVKALLAQHDLDKVDFAVMHGAFEYQLPAIVPEPSHDSATYLSLVRYFILIGHVHIATQHERILAAGSFDRDGHGSEEAKGYFDVTILGEDQYQITFVENKGAKRYVSVDCMGLDTREAMVRIETTLRDLPPQSAVRIQCYTGDPILLAMKELKEWFPHNEFSFGRTQNTTQDRAKLLTEAFTMDLSTFVDITPQSLPTLIEEDLRQFTTDPAQFTRCQEKIRTVVTPP